MQELLKKLNSRKLWALMFWVAVTAYDHDLGGSLAPMFMAYILGQSFVDGVGSISTKG